MVQPLQKTEWRFLVKLKLELPGDPPISFLDIYPKKPKTAFTTTYPKSLQPVMDKDLVHTHKGMLFSRKKKTFLPRATME